MRWKHFALALTCLMGVIVLFGAAGCGEKREETKTPSTEDVRKGMQKYEKKK
jgi:hypothetical protein